MKTLIGLLVIVFLVGCTPEIVENEANDEIIEDEVKTVEVQNWLSMELKDVKSGEMFKISDFEGKPVLIESFAVWCPTCNKQQEETKKLHDKLGDSFVSIGLDTDPNEDEEKVLKHIEDNGFDWRYVVSPREFTQSLIDEFGVGIVNAPSTPIILVCEDQSYRMLESGFKDIEVLENEMNKGC
jgi:thiol-disulfide isomerase/thioredoxin